MSQSNPSSSTTSRTWWRQPRARLLIATATVLVLSLVAGGFAIAHMLSDDAWVADESYDFDICTLVHSADAEPFLQANEIHAGHAPVVQRIGRGLDYQADTEHYHDQCSYWFTSEGTGVGDRVQLRVGPTGDEPTTYEVTDGEELPDVGDSARFYPPSGLYDGATVTNVGEARIELMLKRDSVPGGDSRTDEAEAAEARNLLVPLTEAVLDRYPESFTMPGQLAEGDCALLTDEATQLFDADPTYSRSYVSDQPDQEPVEARSFDCSFVHAGSAAVTVTVKSDTPALQGQIDELDNVDTFKVDGTQVYREDKRYYVVGPDERSLAQVRLGRPGINPDDQEPPEGAELRYLIELAEAALRSPSVRG